MKIAGTISFNPTLWPTLATAVLLPFLVYLGCWQLERAAHKSALLEQFELRGAQTASLPRPDDAVRYQRVNVSGSFSNRQFLLDAMHGSGGAGFHVLSVLQLTDRPEKLIVNRGWIPAAVDRTRLPEPEIPEGTLALAGRLDRLPRPGLELESDEQAAESWPALVLFPTLAELESRLEEPLYPMVLLLDETAPGGFERTWSPVNFGPERHLAYAVQWFALALALLVIFLVVNSQREPRHAT
ncbi:MAG: SURF1 family protein [Gammaproteobacteria bacterium]|nr:SURF1 family protein [Gammaproteobacteria bacterium]